MSQNTKIYQLFYKEEQRTHLDPAFVPYENIDNPKPELREWYIWDKEYENCKAEGLDLWGFVSWKFKEKTGLSGDRFVNFISDNPGYDVYFINPCLINEAVFLNSWEQGDLHHPNISEIGNTFLKKIGVENVGVKEFVLDRNCTTYANYIVANENFWSHFMEFTRKLFTEAEKDSEFHTQVFGEGLSNYGPDKSLPMFTFLIERLLPTFIELSSFKALPFNYTPETLLEKYKPYASDLTALSNLKVLINRYESDDLYYIWDHYRQKFLENNPGILGLE
jgi:hypothetical protein